MQATRFALYLAWRSQKTKNISAVARQFGVTWVTAYTWIQRCHKQKTAHDSPRSGRHAKLTAQDLEVLLQLAKEATYSSSRALASQLASSCNRETHQPTDRATPFGGARVQLQESQEGALADSQAQGQQAELLQETQSHSF